MYHGTDTYFSDVDFGKSRLRTDFGRGFYLTDKLGLAQDWAIDKAGVMGMPIVMRFLVLRDIFNIPVLNRKHFDGTSLEWLHFVRDNRRRAADGAAGEPRHNYDVVIGPIADDKVAVVVNRYLRGVLTAAEALKAMSSIPNVYQLSLHTGKALEYLGKSEYRVFKNNKWGEWKNNYLTER
jgi:hypothetical protein